ncbi:MAG: hypothetical protein AB8B99_18155, partial [Phormidesmis sp.]
MHSVICVILFLLFAYLTIVRTEKGEKIVKKAIRAYGLVNTTKPTKMAMPAIIPGLLSKVGY